MKVLHVLYSERFSGAENVVCQIIGMFRGTQDIEMVYCSPEGPIRDVLKEKNIKYVPIKTLSKREIARVIKEEKPDIIHAHDMRASFVCALACKKIPLISHIHNNAFDSRGLSPKSIAYTFATKKAKHIFWVSKSAYEGYKFHNSVAKKSQVLYNVISIDDLYARMESDKNEYDYDVAYVGRLTYPKNPQRLMNVVSKLRELKPDVKIAVVGSGDEEEETHALCREYGLEGNVDFLGFRNNPLKILHSSKVMIMVSRWEGTPMCALEAMALGVPIVSTPVDGLKDLVIPGENGYLEADDDQLARRLLEIINDADLREKMSENTFEKAKKINDIENYRTQLLNQYR